MIYMIFIDCFLIKCLLVNLHGVIINIFVYFLQQETTPAASNHPETDVLGELILHLN